MSRYATKYFGGIAAQRIFSVWWNQFGLLVCFQYTCFQYAHDCILWIVLISLVKLCVFVGFMVVVVVMVQTWWGPFLVAHFIEPKTLKLNKCNLVSSRWKERNPKLVVWIKILFWNRKHVVSLVGAPMNHPTHHARWTALWIETCPQCCVPLPKLTTMVSYVVTIHMYPST
jgi:hypothetical protein